MVIIDGFFEYLGEQGFYEQLTPQGGRRVNPAGVLKRRREERKQPRNVDVLAAIASIQQEPDKGIALFLYHSGLEIAEACSIDGLRDGQVRVLRRGGRWEWVPLRQEAIAALTRLGGRMPFQPRTIQKRLPVWPSEIRAASLRDHQLRTTHGDSLGPVFALLAGRPALLDTARAYREAVEAMQDPKPRAKGAITAAARALQEMLRAMGAQGNSLGPLFHDARSKGIFEPHDSKLGSAVENLVDWVSADRSQRGDAHVETSPGPDDGWLAIRIVGAVLLRLEATMP